MKHIAKRQDWFELAQGAVASTGCQDVTLWRSTTVDGINPAWPIIRNIL